MPSDSGSPAIEPDRLARVEGRGAHAPERRPVTLDPTDVELVERAQAGDSDAFGVLVSRHQDQAFRVAMRMVPTREDALDICQEAFLKAWRGLGGFKTDAAFSTWLHRIVMNASASFHRRRKAAKRGTAFSLHAMARDGQEDGAGMFDPESPDRRPHEVVEGGETRTLVAEAIAELDDEFREIVVLRDLEGLSYQEIGEALDLAPGTVRSRLHRARMQLAGRLRQLAPDAGNLEPDPVSNPRGSSRMGSR